MKRSRYTEEQIAFALKQAELGTPVPEVCRKKDISGATFYAWRKKFGGLGPSELRRLKRHDWNQKRVHRLYCALNLNIRRRGKTMENHPWRLLGLIMQSGLLLGRTGTVRSFNRTATLICSLYKRKDISTWQHH